MFNGNNKNNTKCYNGRTSLPVSPIELLEHSKENIRKVKRWNDLPNVYKRKLLLACDLLSDTQEYLFNS